MYDILALTSLLAVAGFTLTIVADRRLDGRLDMFWHTLGFALTAAAPLLLLFTAFTRWGCS